MGKEKTTEEGAAAAESAEDKPESEAVDETSAEADAAGEELAKEQEAEREAQVKSDYDKHLDEVKVLKGMTDTEAWQSLYRHFQTQIVKHRAALEDAEKPRDVVGHQQGIKVIRSIISRIRQPVDDLQHFVNSMPLFRTTMHTTAEWNDALGRVDLKAAK